MASFIPSILVMGCCTIQWFVIGYSLAYGEGSGVVGDFKYAFHRGVLAEPVGTIPAILFSEFQLVFCATVCAIAVGGAVERGRVVSLIPFIFVSPPTSAIAHTNLLTLTALGNLHLLSPSSYGLVRNWLPGQSRSPRFRRWDTRAYLQRCDSLCRLNLPLLSSVPLQEISHPIAVASQAPQTRKFHVPAARSRHHLELLASLRCWHYPQLKFQICHGFMRHKSVCIEWCPDLGLYDLLRDREVVA